MVERRGNIWSGQRESGGGGSGEESMESSFSVNPELAMERAKTAEFVRSDLFPSRFPFGKLTSPPFHI
jgi:hypothetical protein